MIDPDGLRLNVGIILTDGAGRLLWAKRAGQEAWQFPQGGIRRGETTRDTLWRELEEELGLKPDHVELLAESRQWLTYWLPRRLVRRGNRPLCVGQRQKWFLLRLTADEGLVRFDATAERPEFDGWRWVDYWRPAAEVVFFKREVYRSALDEFASLLGIVVAEARQAAANGAAERGRGPTDAGTGLDVDLDADLGACAGWLARHR